MSGDQLSSDTVPVRRLDERVRRHQGLIYLAGPQEVFELDEVAQFIWRCVDGHTSIAGIAASLAAEYGIDLDIATEDVTDLISTLVSHDAMKMAAAPSGLG